MIKIIEKIKNWIEEEKILGSKEAGNIVLATADSTGEVHSRVVAIREITKKGVLFFTQLQSRKAKDLGENAKASMTLWLPLGRREVVLDGIVKVLDQSENQHYWDTLPKERQLRFMTHKSGEPIKSLSELQSEYNRLEAKYDNQKIPVTEKYCGYRFIPKSVYFYTLGQENFSEVIKYVFFEDAWQEQLVSP